MKNEMDMLGMKGPERLCWLKACRVTLIAVGVVWIAMIARQLYERDTPWFMIVMIPAFALLRAIVYMYYKRRLSRAES